MEKPALFSAWRTLVVIETHLSRTEVIQRLRREIIGPRALLLLEQYGIVGRIHDRDCWFENRSFWFRGNCRRLRLTFEEGLQGTRLAGTFGISPGSFVSLLILALVWFSLGGRFVVAWLSGQGTSVLPLTAILLAPVAVYGMNRLTLLLVRGGEIELLEHLEGLLASPRGTVPGGTLIRPRHLQPDHSDTHPTC